MVATSSTALAAASGSLPAAPGGAPTVEPDGAWPASSWEVAFYAKKIGIQFKGQKEKRSSSSGEITGSGTAVVTGEEAATASTSTSTSSLPLRVVVSKLTDCVVVGSCQGAPSRMPRPGDALVALNGVDLRGLGWRIVASRLSDANERPLKLRFDAAPSHAGI